MNLIGMRNILSNKWRPRCFDDFTGQTEVVYSLKNILKNKYIPRAFLISGSYGVGKTSLARVLVKCLNCEIGITCAPCGNCYCCTSIINLTNPDSIEVDAASKTKLENTKEIILSSEYKSFKNRFRTYIFDECHMLSLSSFNFLLKILEEESNNNIYILVTTNINKVPDTIKSRCVSLHMKRLSIYDIKSRINYILSVEQIKIEDNMLDKIIFFSHSNLRAIMNTLEKFSGYKYISDDRLNSILGLSDDYIILNILRFLIDKNFKNMFINIRYIIRHGFDVEKVIVQFQLIVYKLILYKFKIKYDKMNIILFKYIGTRVTLKKLGLLNSYLLKYKRFIRLAPNEHIGFEILFMHLCLRLYEIN